MGEPLAMSVGGIWGRRAGRIGGLALAMLLGAVTAGCLPTDMAAPSALPVPVAAAEISARLAGNSLYRSGMRGLAHWEYASFHAPDGTMSARSWWFGGRNLATGRWEVTPEGLYCRRWSNHWAKGQEGCFRVFAAASGELVFDHVSGEPGDATRYEYTVLAGNPYNL